jgi:hypothetical protein
MAPRDIHHWCQRQSLAQGHAATSTVALHSLAAPRKIRGLDNLAVHNRKVRLDGQFRRNQIAAKLPGYCHIRAIAREEHLLL